MIIISAIIVLGILGLVFAALLALAADYFKIEEDPRVGEILALLPGANCGACGEAGCRSFAEKVAKGEASVAGCTVGGAKVAKKIAALMGVEGFEAQKKVSVVHCGANKNQREKAANYYGIQSCAGANLIDSGGQACRYGCLGFGDCFAVCQFDAIKMAEGLPVIDPEKCTACGKCVLACPKKILSLRPYSFPVAIACSSHDKGATVKKTCPVGCIACKICEREVPLVFKVVDNLAQIDYRQVGIDCTSAVNKCPVKCIVRK